MYIHAIYTKYTLIYIYIYKYSIHNIFNITKIYNMYNIYIYTKCGIYTIYTMLTICVYIYIYIIIYTIYTTYIYIYTIIVCVYIYIYVYVYAYAIYIFVLSTETHLFIHYLQHSTTHTMAYHAWWLDTPHQQGTLYSCRHIPRAVFAQRWTYERRRHLVKLTPKHTWQNCNRQ